MVWALILDGFLAVLLILMIVYSFLLNRRLATIRRDKGELELFIQRFNEATGKADASLKGLRVSAETNARIMDQANDKAQALRDELAFLIERADSSAERLAKVSSRPDAVGNAAATGEPTRETMPGGKPTAKAQKLPKNPASKVVSQENDAGEIEASEAERDLLNALRRAR